jgi:hypothetical protein
MFGKNISKLLEFIKPKKIFKKFLLKCLNFFLFFGVDLQRLYHLVFFPYFLFSLCKFKLKKGKVNKIKPLLGDFSSSANLMQGHYFHQDLIVANKIYKKNPSRHIDIGSRLDGFVTHVASFRKIEIFDLRNIGVSKHSNIISAQIDITKKSVATEITDSLSCLHTIEHLGLGRYGDDLDPDGHIKGFKNLLKLLAKEGLLYISFPIATKSRLEFNEQRVFQYEEILQWLKVCGDNYILECFDFIDDSDNIYLNYNISNIIEKLNYGCGIYTIKKI